MFLTFFSCILFQHSVSNILFKKFCFKNFCFNFLFRFKLSFKILFQMFLFKHFVQFLIFCFNILFIHFIYTQSIQFKEYGRAGRYNWRGPPYHMTIYALQAVLNFYEKYLFGVQLPRVQKHILSISFTNMELLLQSMNIV